MLANFGIIPATDDEGASVVVQAIIDAWRRPELADPIVGRMFQSSVNQYCRAYCASSRTQALGAAIIELYDPWLRQPHRTLRELNEYYRFMVDPHISDVWKRRLDERILDRVAREPEAMAEYIAIVALGLRHQLWGSGLPALQIDFLLRSGARIIPSIAAILHEYIADTDPFLCELLARHMLLGPRRQLRPRDWTAPPARELLRVWRWQYRGNLRLARVIYPLCARVGSQGAIEQWAELAVAPAA